MTNVSKGPSKNVAWQEWEIGVAAEIWQREVTDIYGDDVGHQRSGLVIRAQTLIAQALNCSVSRVQGRRIDCGPSFDKPRPAMGGFRASSAAIIERDRRRDAADRRDLTAEFFGDPAPGYSMLDRKRGAPPNA